MRYAVVWEPEADGDLDTFPPLVQSHILNEIDRLAQDPVGLGRPSHFPYRPGGMLFHCEPFEFGGVIYFAMLAFVYGTDEETIILRYIAKNTRP